MKISSVIEKIEALAPLDLQEDWDNSGWQIKLESDTEAKIMLALSPTFDVIEQAKNNGCNLLVTHHPLFFSKLKKITPDTMQNQVAIAAIEAGIQIYAAHTNLDKTQGGINDLLAKLFGLSEVHDEFDIVRVGKVESTSLDEFISKVKTILSCKEVKLINPLGIKEINKVAICSGSGGDFINKVNADLFITGDVKYHTAIEVQDKAVLDAGHFETERIVIPYLKDYLSQDAIIADEKYPWVIL